MSEALIDIDDTGDVVLEMDARVEATEEGRGKLLPFDLGKWRKGLAACAGSVIRVVLLKPKRTRSSAQNRFLWGPFYGELLLQLRVHAIDRGMKPPFATKKLLHEAMKYRFLGIDIVPMPFGPDLEVPATTTKLTPAQFNAYWHSIGEWAAVGGIYLPEPNERAPESRRTAA